MPIVFTPNDEPYLGQKSVYHFDMMIAVAMERNAIIAPWTHNRELSAIQKAATELIPHGFSIALSIRELVRQGYLLSAEILLRPLIERAAVISYLYEHPTTLPQWADGWKHKTRPPLYKMLAAMNGGNSAENENTARQIASHFHSIVHADPEGARTQSIRSKLGSSAYSPSKILDDQEKCDIICLQATSYLIILTSRAAQIFPEASSEQPDN